MKIPTTIVGLVLMMSQGKVWGADPGPSASVGEVSRGRLVHPAVLAGNAMTRVNERTNFGTTELVSVIAKAVAAVNLRFPKTPVVTVGDLSKDGGGFLSGHQSHQAGHDADTGFFMADGRWRKEFDKATPRRSTAGACGPCWRRRSTVVNSNMPLLPIRCRSQFANMRAMWRRCRWQRAIGILDIRAK